MTALALDIGGTKFAAAMVGANGRPVDPKVTPTPTADVWDACKQLLYDVLASANVEAAQITDVGIASAGPVDTTAGVVSPINIAEWYEGFPIVDAVRSLFPDATVTLALDGACVALAEHRFGAGRGVADLVGITVSTGIGGGIVLDGKIVSGRSGNAGHIGHIVVPGSTEPCTCGGVGCVETVASGPNAVRWARSQGWEGDDGIALARAAADGDPAAAAALQRAGAAIGQAIASTAALLDIRLAVVGGGFSEAGPPLWDPLLQSVELHAKLNFLREFRVLPTELGGLGTLTGAAALVSA